MKGNSKFRLSDMMPNAWFYKLRDMSGGRRTRRTQTPSHHRPKNHSPPCSAAAAATSINPVLARPRKSSKNPKSSDTHFPPDLPRKSSSSSSSKIERVKPKPTAAKPSPRLVSSSVSAGCHFRTTINSIGTMPEPAAAAVLMPMEYNYMDEKLIDTFSELRLPPILTKPAAKQLKDTSSSEAIKPTHSSSTSIKTSENDSKKSTPNQKVIIKTSRKVKMRVNSPTMARKSSKSQRIRNLSESFAIVKSSIDPQKDFKESMVEMIEENEIRASKDLEELLACYLSLNSEEYHDLIVKAFEQIWFDMKM